MMYYSQWVAFITLLMTSTNVVAHSIEETDVLLVKQQHKEFTNGIRNNNNHIRQRKLEELEEEGDALPPIPANDLCVQATPVEFGVIYEGNSYGASALAVKGEEGGDASTNLQGGEECGTQITSPAVWYKVTGTGNTLIASTCTYPFFDTKLSIFTSPSGSCEELVCVDGNDDSCGLMSEVFWDSVEGQEYYILVHAFGLSEGAHELLVDDPSRTAAENVQDTTPTVEEVEDFFGNNFVCDNSITLSLGVPVQGNTDDPSNTLVNPNIAAIDCVVPITAPGAWYKIVGTGNELMASTCTGTSYDTKLSVFRSATQGCGNLLCVNGDDDSCDLQSEVSFPTLAGFTYYILVHGFQTLTGAFTIEMNEIIYSSNDQCQSALPISSVAFQQNFSTALATVDNVKECEVTNTAPGIWFSMTGTGNTLYVNTCLFSTFDTKISVFTGSCLDSNNTCVAGNDDACGVRSEVIWDTVAGETYYILVHGFAAETGNFTLSAGGASTSDTSPAPSAPCVNDETWVYEVNGNPEVTRGCNAFAFWRANNFSRCSNPNFVGTNGVPLTVACPISCELCDPTDTTSTPTIISTDVITPTPTAPADSPPVVVDYGNDLCTNAFPILELGVPFLSSTSSATFDDAGECGTVNFAPGVWFAINGTDNTRLRASTCSPLTTYDTKISVYTGSCNELVCVDGNDDYCDEQSEIEWDTSSGEMYYILIHGFSTQTGDFELLVDEVIPSTTDIGGTSSSTEGGCENAVSIEIGVPISSTTVGATLDPNYESCIVLNTGPGVWFTVTAPPRTTVLRASTCSFATFDTKISVYTGTSCFSLFCVSGNDDSCDLQSELTWDAAPSAVYYVYVHGFNADVGEFELLVGEAVSFDSSTSTGGSTSDVSNDLCSNAVNIEPSDFGTALQYTTAGASIDNVGICGENGSNTGPGVWFTVTGNGNRLFASLCSSPTFDTKLGVFTGSCDDLICLVGNDDFCGLQSEVGFDTVVDEIYYILVHGMNTENGDFEIILAERSSTELSNSALVNDLCSSATAITTFGSIPIEATTTGSTFDDVGICGDGETTSNTAPGVWFSVTGMNSTLQASTCSFAEFDTKISVFTGSCDALICVDGNDDNCGVQSTVTWSVLPSEEYFILVHGFNVETGNFELTVEDLGEPASTDGLPESYNNRCSNATVVTELGVPILDSTSDATFDNVGACGEDGLTVNTAPGVWFSVSGMNGTLQASTCSFASFDTKISVFTGSCDNLICVNGNDDSCDVQSAVLWDALPTEVYLILVHGFNTETGDFELMIEEVGPTIIPEIPAEFSQPNDLCLNATIITMMGTPIIGSTENSTFDGTGLCGETNSNTGPGVWYSLTGIDSTLEVSTCSFASFDTKISVFTGSCESLVCVDGNDDSCNVQSSISWDSLSTEEYFILVHGFNTETGDFELTVEDLGARPETPSPTSIVNDVCSDAIAVEVGVPLGGSTVDATRDSVDTCGELMINSAPGVWYSVAGTNSTLQANTCSSPTFDTKISIFTGSCDNLTCVDGNDDFCDVQSSVDWNASPDQEYFILVHGFDTLSGDFQLVVEDLGEIVPGGGRADDFCSGATVITTLGLPIVESTANASVDNVEMCGEGNINTAPGIWFSISNVSGTMVASTCAFASFDTKISVFTGSCDALSCVDGNDDSCGEQSEIAWNSSSTEEYYILVHGFGDSVGDFELLVENIDSMEPQESPMNDQCSAANSITTLGTLIQGSTLGASFDDVGECAISNTGPGVWYSVSGTGGTLQASTCSSSDLDTKISVFTGSCDELVCVDGNDDSCDLQSVISWNSMPNETYFILIHGFGSDTGGFELLVQESSMTMPSSSPVEVADENDLCSAAMDVAPGFPVLGSTVLATLDNVSVCGDSITAPGVWFSVNGTNGMLQADTCSFSSFDTKISVYSGTCDNLVCIDANDDSCGIQSQVSWDSSPNETYLILVHGFGTVTGEFELNVQESETLITSPPTILETQANDVCSGAQNLTRGVPFLDSTFSATSDDTICGESSATQSPGVWYSVTGTNGTLRASTCFFSTYDTQIAVYSGSCDALVCVDGNDDFCDLRSEVTWDSSPAEEYFILVRGFGFEKGEFEIIVEDAEDRFSNTSSSEQSSDACNVAEDITIGVTFQGSTVSASFDDVGNCGSASSTSPGVWFSVVGTGSALRADTCSPSTTFDTKISIFEGSCDSLVCVDGNDDSCGLQSSISWSSTPNVTYFILVHGYLVSTGEFDLTVRERVVEDDGAVLPSLPPAEALLYDDCSAAEIITVGVPVEGSTIFATRDSVATCGVNITSPGVWFSVSGTNNTLRASTCSYASFDTKISVYTGSCENQICVDGDDDSCDLQSAVAWNSLSSEIYYILVHAFGNATGDFVLTVEEVESLENDLCEGAVEISLGIPYLGSTLSATFEDLGTCGEPITSPGVWFAVIGTGDRLRAGTCSSASFDTKISLYTGLCDALLCIDGNDDACDLQSVVTWNSLAGETYYILVHGFESITGDFELIVEEITNASNDACDGAETITLGETTLGSTSNATFDDAGECFGVSNTVPGVWYSLTGANGTILASTCSFATFDTKITVYSGSCDLLTCIDANDDVCGVQSEVTWNALPTENYFIFVHGFGDVGDFELLVEEIGTGIPTSAPAESLVENDLCEAATLVTPGVTSRGSTALATFDNLDFCGASITSPGVWYMVLPSPNSTGTMRASLCSFSTFDTKISVFTGPCGDLNCVGGADDSCGLQAEITWTISHPNIYHILVHGFQSLTGDFELLVEEVEAVSISNDACDGAASVALGEPILGSTSSATVDNMEFCGGFNTAPGVWYSLNGTGSLLVASTCSFASYDTKVSVFSGSCDDLLCVSGNDDSCGTQSQVIWESLSSEVYFILVHGFENSTGDFELTVEETDLELLPTASPAGSETENDGCGGAIDLNIGVPFQGSTTSSTFDNVAFCGVSITAPGVWYAISGIDGTLQASTCSPSLYDTLDTKISVFSGSCGDLICVDGNDDFCDLLSTVTWNALSSEVYYILVHGFGELTGDFQIIVEEVGPSATTLSPIDSGADNDVCFSAIDLTLGMSIQGSTSNATFDNVGRCDTSNTGPGVWFSITGTGATLNANTCSFASYDTKISVLAGSCDTLSCVGGNDDSPSCGFSSEIEWDSSLGEIYFVLVHGFGTTAGDFELIVVEARQQGTIPAGSNPGMRVPTLNPTEPLLAAPDNDLCDRAPIVELGTLSIGSTSGATFDDVGRCGAFNTAPGVWYSFSGTGNTIYTSTCSFASFDTAISVFTGSCSELFCVGGNDDSCDSQSEVIFDSQPNQVYYILVHGFSALTGDFELLIEDLAAVEGLPTLQPTPLAIDSTIESHDDCNDSITLSAGSEFRGSTVGATFDDVGTCGSALNSGPGVWLSIVGTGQALSVSTCEFASFDTSISIFLGICGDLVCLDGNDDSCGLQSAVTWNSVPGQLYYILVHGFADQTGEFELSVKKILEEEPPLPNNICAGAVGIAPGVLFQGSTIGASIDTEFCGVKAAGYGVWFSVIGTGNRMVANTCEFASFDTQISVFSGSCDELSCVGGNDDSCDLRSEVTWYSVVDTEYFILVQGYLSARGDFELVVDDVA